MSITINNVSHRYDDVSVVCNASLHVKAGEVLCLLGPSGSGKSTLLRLVAGLESVQEGELSIGELNVSSHQPVPPEDRRVGLVFQDHALFPHMTVAENIGFGLRSEADRKEVDAMLTDVGLVGFEDRYPGTMSGGQQQRVALVRALASQPIAMLMDEPFASVDVALRQSLREEARRILKRRQIPTIFVTHDPEEAMLIGDRIACIVDGTIVQIGTPQALWEAPAHSFVALAISNAQRITGKADAGGVVTKFGRFQSPQPVEGPVEVCIRAGGVSVVPGDQAKLIDVRFLDGEFVSVVQSHDELLSVRSVQAPSIARGAKVGLAFATELIEVYPLPQ